jgi:metal-responsive CopG/Arc/MetJ family transcriptional regulator
MKRRIHVWLDPTLIRSIDELVGPRRRSSFVEDAVRLRLDQLRLEDRYDLWEPERALWARQAR